MPFIHVLAGYQVASAFMLRSYALAGMVVPLAGLGNFPGLCGRRYACPPTDADLPGCKDEARLMNIFSRLFRRQNPATLDECINILIEEGRKSTYGWNGADAAKLEALWSSGRFPKPSDPSAMRRSRAALSREWCVGSKIETASERVPGARRRAGTTRRGGPVTSTIVKKRCTVRHARLAPVIISTPGHRVLRRRQRSALPAWLPWRISSASPYHARSPRTSTRRLGVGRVGEPSGAAIRESLVGGAPQFCRAGIGTRSADVVLRA
jgi:hypothetical protein